MTSEQAALLRDRISDLTERLPDRRTLLAGMALQGMLASREYSENTPEELAFHAVRKADALIAALDAKNPRSR